MCLIYFGGPRGFPKLHSVFFLVQFSGENCQFVGGILSHTGLFSDPGIRTVSMPRVTDIG